MTLTDEEKTKIAGSATFMMQKFYEFRMAEDRLATMNKLSSNMLRMALDAESLNAAIQPYLKRYQDSRKCFLETIGIPEEDNKI